MKNLTGKIIGLCLAVAIIVSCNKDDDNDLPTNTLENSIWKSEGANCDSYFDFKESTFISINPCNNNGGDMDILAWTSGTYRTDSNELILTTEESCEQTKIGQSSTFKFNIESDVLTLTVGSNSLELTRVQSVPNIPANVEYGYWDFDNGGAWVKTASCSSPY
jgi:hypothetical protein